MGLGAVSACCCSCVGGFHPVCGSAWLGVASHALQGQVSNTNQLPRVPSTVNVRYWFNTCMILQNGICSQQGTHAVEAPGAAALHSAGGTSSECGCGACSAQKQKKSTDLDPSSSPGGPLSDVRPSNTHGLRQSACKVLLVITLPGTYS